MTMDRRLGVLLPEDGPPDYEWYGLEKGSGFQSDGAPGIEVGQIASDGHHAREALLALGATERLSPVGERLVHERGAQAVVWACTSGSFIGGLEWAQAQSRDLSAHLGVPVISTALAFREALHALGCRRVDLLSPYPEGVTEQLVGFLRDSDVAVGNVEFLDCPYAADSHQLDIVEEVRRFCDANLNEQNPLLVPDTAINTLELVETLNQVAGRVVLTANQVSLWAGLRLLQWPNPPAQYLNRLAGVE